MSDFGGQTRFSSSEIIGLLACTLRNLQYWDENRLIRPKLEGGNRIYTAGQVVQVAIVLEMRDRGAPLRFASVALAELKKYPDSSHVALFGMQRRGDSLRVVTFMSQARALSFCCREGYRPALIMDVARIKDETIALLETL